MAQRKLFGTDGVRGLVGEAITSDLARALGMASVRAIGKDRPRIALLRDTRESGPELEVALASGAAAQGADVLVAGVLPTPAASMLIERYELDLAAVISASHNPYHDNGIKFFGADGMKLNNDLEREIERLVGEMPGGSANGGSVTDLLGGSEDFTRQLEMRFENLSLKGRKILLDTANGATFEVAPEIFQRLGADVTVMADLPDGRNINADCGSTHLDGLIAKVREGDYEIGFAFDGDGDRVLAVDGNGRIFDGDEMIALVATHMVGQNALSGLGVVVTVMTNYGFHTAMKAAGIEVATTDVGDRFVLEELVQRGWRLGGEQSGHIIDRAFVPTGDGIAAALLVMEALMASDRRLAETHVMEKLPQRLINIRVADREAIARAKPIWDAVNAQQEALTGRGRVLLRPSGTEPLVRVMVEAPGQDETDEICRRLADLVERELA